jgi:hypothetical protein
MADDDRDNPNLAEWLRPIVRLVVEQVLAEAGHNGGPPQLYDVAAAAKILAVPKRWLYERSSKGTLPCQRLGKYIRFTDADLREIVRQSGK